MDDSTQIHCLAGGFRLGMCGDNSQKCCDGGECKPGYSCEKFENDEEPICHHCGGGAGRLCCNHQYCADATYEISPASSACNHSTNHCDLCGHRDQMCCDDEAAQCVDGLACKDGRCQDNPNPDPTPNCSSLPAPTFGEGNLTEFSNYCEPTGELVEWDPDLKFARCILGVDTKVLVDEAVIPCHSNFGVIWDAQPGINYTVFLREVSTRLADRAVSVFPNQVGPFFQTDIALQDGQTRVFQVAVRATSCGGNRVFGFPNLGMMALNKNCGIAPRP
jgi:hypothetical protein